MTVTIEQLSAYQDGDLVPDEHRAVAAHVAQCRDCQRALDVWSTASRMIERAPRRSVAWRRSVVALAAAVLVLVAASGTAIAQNWFNEIFRIGNVSAVGSRPVSLAEARTTGLPLPSTSELPGGWVLHDRGAVQLTRTPTWTTVELQYDRGGQRGMNVRISTGLNVFDPSRERYDEILTASGTSVYVTRQPDAGRIDHVRAVFTVRDATVEVFAFGPAVVGRPFTSEELSTLAMIWQQMR